MLDSPARGEGCSLESAPLEFVTAQKAGLQFRRSTPYLGPRLRLLPAKGETVTRPAKKSLETILVVEDDQLVLETVSSILEDAGFCVLSAANSTEAIEIERTYVETIHLLLSDVMMPDMSGPVISKLLKKHRPELRVILMSGYPDGDMLFLNHGWHFIEKEFLATKLVERVTEVLHTPIFSQGEDHFDDTIDQTRTAPR